ncbi:hypothetical protein L585_02690 [Pantoea ananatis BRT175]|uniref:hypothetical protein n=1 Tax=Pantoea ananas TaxID=553 RepID=UPI0003B240BB|nr:hypothetical protein [Pantoea ananatis]ERM15749.1 hypothetical protein L585_02690 [Pantoea ananatis BRT175]MDH0053783.1 hypothetical protein [Pantoea ananatis]
MVDDGFDKDDLDSTLARFKFKGQTAAHEEAKLKHIEPAPVTLSSATDACGRSVIKNISKSGTKSDVKQKYESSVRFSWEKQGFFRFKDGF